jgi:uncharacterized protein YqfA (UPF0365 family)
MRRAATAIVLIALALLLFAPFVRGAVFITVLAALTISILVVAGRRVRRAGASLVPWLVALAIGVVTTTPQVATAHYKHVAGGVFAGVFWSLLVALYLRFVIFLADYFRRSRAQSGAGVRS